VQKLLSSWGRNKTGTAGCRNKTGADGSTLSGNLAGYGVRHTSHTSPVSSADGNYVQLGDGDGTTNGSSNFSGTLDSKADMTSAVTDGNESLKPGALSSRTLLLHRHDLHDLVVKLVLEQVIDDFGFLHGKRKEENLFDGVDFSFLYKTTEFGDGNPGGFLITTTASATTPPTVTTTTVATTTVTTSSSTAETSTFSFS